MEFICGICAVELSDDEEIDAGLCVDHIIEQNEAAAGDREYDEWKDKQGGC